MRVVRYDVPSISRASTTTPSLRAPATTCSFSITIPKPRAKDWIAAMVEQAQRPAIGAVGALFSIPTTPFSTPGSIIGLGGVAGHSHKHFRLTRQRSRQHAQGDEQLLGGDRLPV